jgi:aminopeptidase-like protein
MLGTNGEHALQYSHQGETLVDRAMEHVLSNKESDFRTGDFREIIGNDEMVTNGPGVKIPTISLSRWPYDEYHTSLDTPEVLSGEQLSDSVSVVLDIIGTLERNCVPVQQFRGPIFLSGVGLWEKWGGRGELRQKSENIMMCLEGSHSILDIALKHDLSFDIVYDFITDLVELELVELHEDYVDRDV